MISFENPNNFRSIILQSLQTERPIEISDINKNEELPKLRDYEAIFLNMIQKVTNGTRTIVSKSGNYVKIYPGPFLSDIPVELEFDCGKSRSISYYLEYQTIMALFTGNSFSMKMTGITNDEFDPSIDTMNTNLTHILGYFGVEGLKIHIKKRGFRPEGRGEIYVSFPKIKELKPCHQKSEGLIKRIRGIACASKCSVSILNRMISSAREILNDYIPDVWIYSEYSKGKAMALSSGYALSLSAESLSTKRFTNDICYKVIGDKKENTFDNLPEEMGKLCALQQVDEIMYSGSIDTTFQSFVQLLMSLSEKNPSVVKLGRISEYTIENIRLIKQFTGVMFKIEEVENTNAIQNDDDQDKDSSDSEIIEEKVNIQSDFVEPKCVLFTCIGIGLKNKASEMKQHIQQNNILNGILSKLVLAKRLQ